MKPTEDTKLHDRLTQMFNTAESTWEWSSSKKVADKRRDIFIYHLLTVLEDWGYHKDSITIREAKFKGIISHENPDDKN